MVNTKPRRRDPPGLVFSACCANKLRAGADGGGTLCSKTVTFVTLWNGRGIVGIGRELSDSLVLSAKWLTAPVHSGTMWD